jgi:hypothetical protein
MTTAATECMIRLYEERHELERNAEEIDPEGARARRRLSPLYDEQEVDEPGAVDRVAREYEWRPADRTQNAGMRELSHLGALVDDGGVRCSGKRVCHRL